MSRPVWVKPQLAALVKKAPDGPDWLHEMNLDGQARTRRPPSTPERPAQIDQEGALELRFLISPLRGEARRRLAVEPGVLHAP